MADSISYFPYPIGITSYSSPNKFVLDLARELYANYIITDAERDAYRAISYAYTFWNCLPEDWKNSITGNPAKITVSIGNNPLYNDGHNNLP